MNKIILIGGPPRSGKTTLAQKISKELHIPWISTDAFDDIAKNYVPKDDLDRLFPKSALRRKSGGDNDALYATYSAEEITSAYLAQAEAVHAAIEAFVVCANIEGWDYVIEGYHVTPKIIAKLKSENPNMSSVVLTTENGEEVIQRSMKSDTKQDWLRDNTKNQETFHKVGEMISVFSKKLKDEATKYNVQVVDTGDDFQTKITEAASLVENG